MRQQLKKNEKKKSDQWPARRANEKERKEAKGTTEVKRQNLLIREQRWRWPSCLFLRFQWKCQNFGRTSKTEVLKEIEPKEEEEDDDDHSFH